MDDRLAGAAEGLEDPAGVRGGGLGLVQRAAALSDPTRMALALALRDGGEVCVCDLSWILGRPVQLISHHLAKMRGAGVVVARQDGRLVRCRLTPTGARLLEALSPAVAAAGVRDAA
ncbi:MAG: ArsR/SmtB family transcription factor [Solirubrobacteraceae bacterium]